jgi:hypothetical protein
MRKLLLIAGVAALTAPAVALAQPPGPPPAAADVGADVAYTGPQNDLAARANWLEARIHELDSAGVISEGDAKHDFDTLAGIRQFEARKRDDHDGVLGEKDRANVINKLDNLSAEVSDQRRH